MDDRPQKRRRTRLTQDAQRAEAANTEAMNGVEEAAEDGEIDSSAAAPTKVHIRGLNQLNTLDIERFAEEHYSMDLFKKVQWVDDVSANLIYDTEVAATEALIAFSAEDVSDPLQLRPAKRVSSHPDTDLQVRLAIVADVKAPGAKDRSAFYLFNKEWDPDNPDNIRPGYKRRRRPDDAYPANKYRRREWEDSRYHRRESRDKSQFHEDMYGEDTNPSGEVRRGSYSSGSEYGKRRPKGDEDLFASKQNGRLRNRSASPGREGDGRYGFHDDQPRRPTARPRSRTPPAIRAGNDNRGARDNLRKELFPERKSSSALTNGHSSSNSRELFPTRPSSSASSKELFPDKINGAVHRRQKAKDLHPDEIADAIGKYNLDGTNERGAYNSSGRRPENSERSARGESRDLFSRINGGPKVESSYGRLHERPPTNSGETGFSIKGAGRFNDTAGFSILGASKERAENPLVKELFPTKAGGKDLFDGRIKGRGVQRRRAEDLF